MGTLNVKTFQPLSCFIDAKKSNSNFQKIIINTAHHPIVNCTIYLWLEIILSKLVQKNYSEVSYKWIVLGLNKRVGGRSQTTFIRRGR